jgi:hypothetical protein
VVVAVGFTLVEPLAEVEVNVPGVMLMLAAPVVVQLSVLLAPELIVAGFAPKELIVGCGELPPEELDAPPQPASPTEAERRRVSVSFPILLSRRGIENVDESCYPPNFMPGEGCDCSYL